MFDEPVRVMRSTLLEEKLTLDVARPSSKLPLASITTS
jgi:hypothetical protein